MKHLKTLNERISKRGILPEGNEGSESGGFGLTDDGWDHEGGLADLMETLNKFQAISYELESARRGSYGIEGDTIDDLLNTLLDAKSQLQENIENIAEMAGIDMDNLQSNTF